VCCAETGRLNKQIAHNTKSVLLIFRDFSIIYMLVYSAVNS